ncbi:MAG: hypothetical protein M3O91_07875 [Chloroflexota bacterium]|nr:hypothetical protein [Chloroflexota bacterium]
MGTQVIFGLDGSFVASAYGYPLGANWHWSELDRDGTLLREFEWRQVGIIQSPDGSRLAYGGQDPVTGKTGLFARELSGPERFVAQIDGRAYGWLDADHVLVESPTELGPVRAIDIRAGTDRIVFAPPPPPTPKAADSDYDSFSLTADLRWAVFTRTTANGVVLRQDLYDVVRQTYVPGVSLGTKDIRVAPAGDVALWVEGSELRAMHFCDRKVTTIGSVPASSSGLRSFAWSTDGRFASFSFGDTNEENGPERIVVVDLWRGAIAEIDRPWGYIRQWSPDGRFVVLTRRGYHVSSTKLATFEFR